MRGIQTMYKVLLVDDERMILEGISSIMDWKSQGTVLCGKAKNGIEAFDYILEHQPDIVISDIRMPGMDGLQLVEKTKEMFPTIEFILLSGFDEFDYARTAMSFGVKHYLLKPCNEESIEQALQDTVNDIKQRETRNQFLQNMQNELKKVLPHVKQQFLKELVTNKTYGSRDWNDFKQLFDLTLDDQKVRIILFQIEGQFEFEHMFALNNITEDIMNKQVLLLSTTIGKHVLFLIKDQLEQEVLLKLIDEIRTIFGGFYHKETTTALSEADEITNARRMYRETLECLNHRFYLGEGSLITHKDIQTSPMKVQDTFEIDEERFILLVKAGRWVDVNAELIAIFDSLQELRLETIVAKSYLIQLYLSIIRQSGSDNMQQLLKEVAKMEEMDTLHSLQEFITAAAKDITESNYHLNKRKNSNIINKITDIVRENLGNPMLSLQWVANEMIYMNADYMGKLFKKETGEKFSNFVMKARIDKAVEYMREKEDFKVFELAESLGFGDNPQYFSQVFKKYTGFTPSEFMKAPLK
jgi:two-component system response regulator YesN